MNVSNIYPGVRGEQFKLFLKDLLLLTDLSGNDVDKILTDKNINLYSQAFTGLSAHPENNYERFEQMGDVSINKFIVQYSYKMYPQLNCTEGVKVIARLKINYASKKILSEIGQRFKFWEYISAIESVSIKPQDKKYFSRENNYYDLLEDCVESFIGCTEFIFDREYEQIGIGYIMVYKILTKFYADIKFSLKYDDIYDATTRLKETLDYINAIKMRNNTNKYRCKQKTTVRPEYLYDDFFKKRVQKHLAQITITIINNETNETQVFETGFHQDSLKNEAIKLASQEAIEKLKYNNLERPESQFYKIFCQSKQTA